MKIIGLTGSIASGKSTVAAMLAKANIPVIDADQLAREATKKNSVGLHKIVTEFGDDILTTEGTLDRKALGQRVFDNASLRKKLENILHPIIEQERLRKLEELKSAGHEVAVYMAPLIFEAALHKKLDATILVVAPMDIMIERIMKRDSLSRTDAEKRIRAQLDDETKASLADAVIVNDGSPAMLLEKLASTWKAVTGIPLMGSFRDA